MAAAELARLNAALQVELVAIKAETTAKVTSLEDTIANLAHENELLKRRLYGNKDRAQSHQRDAARAGRPARRRGQAAGPSSTTQSARPQPRSARIPIPRPEHAIARSPRGAAI